MLMFFWLEMSKEDKKLKHNITIKKGSLKPGYEADLCVLDLNKPWAVNKSELKSKSKNTPIENRKLQGQVLKTLVKGQIVFERN